MQKELLCSNKISAATGGARNAQNALKCSKSTADAVGTLNENHNNKNIFYFNCMMFS